MRKVVPIFQGFYLSLENLPFISIFTEKGQQVLSVKPRSMKWNADVTPEKKRKEENTQEKLEPYWVIAKKWYMATKKCFKKDRFWLFFRDISPFHHLTSVTSAEQVCFEHKTPPQTFFFSKNGAHTHRMKNKCHHLKPWRPKAQRVSSASEKSYQDNWWPARMCSLNLCRVSSCEAFGSGRRRITQRRLSVACTASRRKGPAHRFTAQESQIVCVVFHNEHKQTKSVSFLTWTKHNNKKKEGKKDS